MRDAQPANLSFAETIARVFGESRALCVTAIGSDDEVGFGPCAVRAQAFSMGQTTS
jgi:hypothetical protein